MKKLLLITLALAVLLGGCSNGTDKPAATAAEISDNTVGVDIAMEPIDYNADLEPQAVEALDENFVSGINAFGIDAAALLYDTEKNLALSPVSIELALAMTQAGASGTTADEMKSALGLAAMSNEQIAAACKSLMWRANTGGMEAANALWLSDRYTFTDDFLGTCAEDFMADALPLVIPCAKDAINTWASDKTHGRIKSILAQEPSPDTALMLTNALYFLGEWEMPFEAANTHDLKFFAPSGTVETPFMSDTWHVPYYEGSGFKVISLDFKSEPDAGQYAMAFLLPDENSDIGDMLAMLDGMDFAQLLEDMAPQEVRIGLPKFEFEYGTSLVETLQALGMTQAFGADADFTPMTEEAASLFISNVLHKCYIRVDELGAEAAAVTAVVMAEGAAMSEPEVFFANRPFVFAIYSREDGAIAFMGAVNNPEA